MSVMIRFRKINITDVVAKVIFRSKDVLTAWKQSLFGILVKRDLRFVETIGETCGTCPILLKTFVVWLLYDSRCFILVVNNDQDN